MKIRLLFYSTGFRIHLQCVLIYVKVPMKDMDGQELHYAENKEVQ